MSGPRRRWGRVGASAALVAGSALVVVAAAAPPASAAGTFDSPEPGATYRTDGTVQLRVRLGPLTRSVQLHLREPGGRDPVVAQGGSIAGGDVLAFDLDTACPAYPGVGCTGRRPAPAGTWTAHLTGDARGERTFVLRIPPAAPGGLTAQATGPATARLSWADGPEPDLTGYELRTADGQRLTDTMARQQVCTDGVCAVDLAFGDSAAGRHDIVAVAHRSCPGCGGDLASPPSDPAVVTLSGAPGSTTPGPTTPAGGGTATASPSRSGSADAAELHRRRFGSARDAAGLGAAPLAPPVPVPGVSRVPLPRGDYAPRLDYRPSWTAVKVPERRPVAPAVVTSGARRAGMPPEDHRRLWEGLAAALVLAATAGHVWRWSRQPLR